MLHLIRTIVSLIFTLFLHITFSAASTYNVKEFGAQGGGNTDASKAFLDAWAAACASPDESKVYAPGEVFLIADTITFSGQGCTNKSITFQIDGTLAASDYTAMANSENWIVFRDLNWVTIYGGVLDGKGQSLWDCKNSGNRCPVGATTLAFYNSQNVVINKLQSVNSKLFNALLYGCQFFNIQGVKISNPDSSPNTDGIHLAKSRDITIFDANIGTGDDCISIGPGVVNLRIEKISCGPGHGISIGSLGWIYKESGVRNVTVKNVAFYGTQNGVRIKTWSRKTRGYVDQVLFQNITMANAENPILIDQNYCPGSEEDCPHEGSGVKIYNVTYQQIHGTSADKVALTLNCSNVHPCRHITLDDIYLTYEDQPAEAQCSNASGASYGTVVPSCNLSA